MGEKRRGKKREGGEEGCCSIVVVVVVVGHGRRVREKALMIYPTSLCYFSASIRLPFCLCSLFLPAGGRFFLLRPIHFRVSHRALPLPLPRRRRGGGGGGSPSFLRLRLPSPTFAIEGPIRHFPRGSYVIVGGERGPNVCASNSL